jgi:hypothetical protein
VSSIVVTTVGGSVRPEIRLASGFSIFCGRRPEILGRDDEFRRKRGGETYPAALQSAFDVAAA